ncbi:MAG: hypothetical protein R3B07_35835 [Polyangiaceae bacterium]
MTTPCQRLSVDLRDAPNGEPQPTLEVRLPKGTPARTVRATLYRILAEVEAATPESESWTVHLEWLPGWPRVAGGTVVIRLDDGSPEEGARAHAVLWKVVDQQPRQPAPPKHSSRPANLWLSLAPWMSRA